MLPGSSVLLSRPYTCGPVRVHLACPDPRWLDRLDSVLALYDAPWPAIELAAGAEVVRDDGPPPRVAGDYLQCARFRVDRTASGLRLAALSGVWADYDLQRRQAQLHAPGDIQDDLVREDLEQCLLLLVTEAWRGLGWTPLHAGSLVRDGCCAVVCAASGVGKTSFVAAMLDRGWRTLGDDKLLIRAEADGRVVAASVSRGMNLDPATRQWLPRVGDLEALPRYSRWTGKRKVSLESIWPGCTLDRAQPTHLVRLGRHGAAAVDRHRPGIRPLSAVACVECLTRQVVIPQAAGAARLVLGAASSLARQVRGLEVEAALETYRDPAGMAALEEALR